MGVLAAAALAVSACGGPAPDEFTKQDATSIRQEMQQYVEAFNGKQLDRLMDLYAESSVFMPPNAPIIRGKASVKSFYEELVNEEGATGLEMNLDEVAGHGPIAYQTGRYEMRFAAGESTPRRDRCKFLMVLREVGGKWRYEYTMWSSDLPQPTAGRAAD
jgi:ketosteroid isomerase-like protein